MTQTINRKKLLTIRQFDEMSVYLEKQTCCQCEHSFTHTLAWMRAHNVADLQGNIEKFFDLMCSCDCDLLEVLDDEQWETERNKPVSGPTIHGVNKWNSAIMEAMLEAS